MKKIVILVFLTFLMLGMTGCQKDGDTDSTTTVSSETTTEVSTSTSTGEEASTAGTTESDDGSVSVDASVDPSTLDDVVLDGLTQDIMEDMTLEEKIGQLFIVNVELLDPADPESYEYKNITKVMKTNMEEYKAGGIIFFSRNIKTPKQTKKFIDNLQESSKIPMFMSVDEEGGSISRIGKNKKMKISTFPDMADIGATGDSSKAFEVGDTIGKEIKELGFNLNFAPVADVNTNPDSPEIGARSFSEDPEVAADMVEEVVKGLQGQGISATLKHFPGHGDAINDTHKGYANVDHTIKRLRKVEFVPFKAGIEAGADLVMVSHLAVSQVTEKEVPASMSPLIITDILRNELGFKNLVITDALNMKAITKVYEPGDAAVTAIKAGADLLLMPENIKDAYKAILNAVKDDKITEDRIDESVNRIIRTKIKRGIIALDSPLFEGNISEETQNETKDK